MKKADEWEIYSVRLNKAVLKDGDIHFTTYTVGQASVFGMTINIPLSITLKDNKITVEFDNNARHVFTYSDDVELFMRKIEKDGGNTKTKADTKRIG